VSTYTGISEWLALREPADAEARASELLEPLRRLRPPLLVHDLGCGTGSMGRWLAPRLPGPQHWVLYDRDPELLDQATVEGATVETRRREISTLTAADFAGGSLVTGSALLDVLTREEVERVAEACAGAGCPALFTLSVVGRAELSPADPLDREIEAAFNAHQRRVHAGRRQLGPDAPGVAAEAFGRHGATVLARPSPWRLGPARAALTAEWLRQWVAAACAQRPELERHAAGYLRRRLAGELRVVVEHSDLLALPG
jgi:SAM-dependent methyltransferase